VFPMRYSDAVANGGLSSNHWNVVEHVVEVLDVEVGRI
jgi:hypothetical protein